MLRKIAYGLNGILAVPYIELVLNWDGPPYYLPDLF